MAELARSAASSKVSALARSLELILRGHTQPAEWQLFSIRREPPLRRQTPDARQGRRSSLQTALLKAKSNLAQRRPDASLFSSDSARPGRATELTVCAPEKSAPSLAKRLALPGLKKIPQSFLLTRRARFHAHPKFRALPLLRHFGIWCG
jgi:hypothetical protein